MSRLPSFVVPRMGGNTIIAHLTGGGRSKVLLHGGTNSNYQRQSQVNQDKSIPRIGIMFIKQSSTAVYF